MTRPTTSTVAARVADSPHCTTANVVRNGIAPYWQTDRTVPTAVGRAITDLNEKR